MSKLEHFVKIANGFQLLIIFTKRLILNVWLGSEYAYNMFIVSNKISRLKLMRARFLKTLKTFKRWKGVLCNNLFFKKYMFNFLFLQLTQFFRAASEFWQNIFRSFDNSDRYLRFGILLRKLVFYKAIERLEYVTLG